MLMIIHYELIDFTEVIRIKVVAPYTEVSWDRFGKELSFVCVCLGSFLAVLDNRADPLAHESS